MSYDVIYNKSVQKYLEKMDTQVSLRITTWIEKNLAGCEDPRSVGKALRGKYTGAWRYRIGEYRVIVDIKDKELIIIVIDIGSRKNIYY